MKKYLSILIILFLISCNNFHQPSTMEISEKDKSSNKETVKQSRIHKKLSKQYNYQTSIKRIPTEYSDSCIVKIVITNKENNTIVDSIILISTDLQNDSLFLDNNVRSYLTGTNINEEIIDNDYGYLVVADFNFDGLEDFALTRNYGSNRGPLYNFYIQTDHNEFEKNQYLSDVMIWFPNKIDNSNETLKTLVMATYTSVCETTYQFNFDTQKWTEIKKEYLGDDR